MHIEEINLNEGIFNATLTAYIQNPTTDQKDISLRPAILICPGGAYISITDKEAEPVALRFISSGYQAFVLKYSIGAGLAHFPTPFLDAAKAILIIRENAHKWSINPDKIILCGFSTGGHLAAILATSWNDSYFSKALKVDNVLIKPNAVVLGYPLLDLYKLQEKHSKHNSNMQSIIEMMFASVFGTVNPNKDQLDEWNIINRITTQMPPTFMWTTSEDALIDVEESLDLVKKLSFHGIPYEFHVFEKGAHGLSLGDQSVGYNEYDIKEHINASRWIELALNWINYHLE